MSSEKTTGYNNMKKADELMEGEFIDQELLSGTLTRYQCKCLQKCRGSDQTTLVTVVAKLCANCDVVDFFRKKIKSCCCLVYPLRRSSGLKSIHHSMSVGKKKGRTFWKMKKRIGDEKGPTDALRLSFDEYFCIWYSCMDGVRRAASKQRLEKFIRYRRRQL
jgi:hypothetical protein